MLLTNLSRVLVAAGDAHSLESAKAYLDQAAQYADRAFVWWRAVKDDWSKAMGGPVRHQKGPPSGSAKGNSDSSICQRGSTRLRSKSWRRNCAGRQFEDLFVDLLRLTFGSENVQGSHQIGMFNKRQVDAVFKWQGVLYRVELKWHKRALGPEVIDVFRTILDTAEVRGLMVSMSGYTDGAIEAAYTLGKEHTLLLLDGEEMRRIFDGASRLELLIEKKLDSFQRTGNPYGKDTQADAGSHPD